MSPSQTRHTVQKLLDQECFHHNAKLGFDTYRLEYFIEHTHGDETRRYTIPIDHLSLDVALEMIRSIHSGRQPDASPAG